MLDILGMVGALSRPKLLVRAARFGIDDYSRALHLGRILKTAVLPRSGPAILQLLELETDMNDRRLAHAADYSVADHIDVLIAIMGEVQVLRAATRVD